MSLAACPLLMLKVPIKNGPTYDAMPRSMKYISRCQMMMP